MLVIHLREGILKAVYGSAVVGRLKMKTHLRCPAPSSQEFISNRFEN